VEGGSGVSVVSSQTRVAGVGTNSDGVGGGSNIGVMGVGDDGGSNGVLDDGLASNSHRDRDLIGSIHMDGGGDLDDLLGVEGSVIGSIHTPLDKDGLLDVVDLSHVLDDGGVVCDRSSQDGGDGDGEMRGGGLDDPGFIAGHVAGLSEVDLLGDDRGGLVDSGDALGLGVGGVGGWDGRGNIGDGGMGHNGASGEAMSCGGRAH
jgi:hypothetical protein